MSTAEQIDAPTVIPVPAVQLAKLAGERLAFDSVTLRDFYTGFALAGLLASHSGETALPDERKAATWALGYADAVLALRGHNSD